MEWCLSSEALDLEEVKWKSTINSHCLPVLRLSLNNPSPLSSWNNGGATQWAAVSTVSELSKDPPHKKLLNYVKCNTGLKFKQTLTNCMIYCTNHRLHPCFLIVFGTSKIGTSIFSTCVGNWARDLYLVIFTFSGSLSAVSRWQTAPTEKVWAWYRGKRQNRQ